VCTDKDDLYFAIGTLLALVALGVALLTADWTLVRGRIRVPFLKTPMIIVLCLILASLGLSSIGWYISLHQSPNCIHFKPTKGQTVYGQHFLNQEVELDNRYFEECTFENVTFIYHGIGPTGFKNTRANLDPPLKGVIALKTDNDAAKTFSLLQNGLRNSPGVVNFTVNSTDAHGNTQQLFPIPASK
jgi:hypothetical protein